MTGTLTQVSLLSVVTVVVILYWHHLTSLLSPPSDDSFVSLSKLPSLEETFVSFSSSRSAPDSFLYPPLLFLDLFFALRYLLICFSSRSCLDVFLLCVGTGCVGCAGMLAGSHHNPPLPTLTGTPHCPPQQTLTSHSYWKHSEKKTEN